MGNKSNQDNQGLLQELQDRVDKWIEANPMSRNLAVLARKISVNDSTLRRMLAGECKLSFEAVVLMLQEVCPSRKEMYRIVANYYPKLVRNLLINPDDLSTEEEKKSVDLEVLESYLSESMNFKVWLLAQRKTFNLEMLEKELGLHGRRSTERMMNDGILELNDEGLLKIAKKYEMNVLPLRLFSKFYERSAELAIHAKNKTFFSQISWINKEAYNQINELSLEHQNKLNSILKSSSSAGDVPVAVNQLLTRLDATQSDTMQVKEN